MVKRLILTLVLIIFAPSLLSANQIIPTTQDHIVTMSRELYPFVEPIEICYVITVTGRVIRITSQLPHKIWFIPSFEDVIKEYDIELKDIFIIIHNHLKPGTFSEQDIRLYRNLRRNGFKGAYLLYTPGGKVLWYAYPGEEE